MDKKPHQEDDELVMKRLRDAVDLVLRAAPVLMSEKYEFHGDEISGKRRVNV